ncbi:hypothetical protein EVAR_57509_1 [Eumeta japonica]|uniref:Uncharacterized protein n=1 Tax=Eumeta variegata TaxID=151549 RepID=A0A4C1ZFW2_EUMVA|nr:hypothetical protein EVAR_57509_1 [Eumeta japonica]
MGLRRLRSSYGHFPLHHQTLSYHVSNYSSREIKRAKLDGLRRLITSSYGHLQLHHQTLVYHIVSKYSSRQIKRAQTRWGLRRLITEFPMATFWLHHQTLITI